MALGGLLFIWVVFQGCGMVFSDMATDPNTPMVWGLLLVPSWLAAHGQSWDWVHPPHKPEHVAPDSMREL